MARAARAERSSRTSRSSSSSTCSKSSESGAVSLGRRVRRPTRTAAGAAWQLSLLVSPRPGASILRRAFAANGAAVAAALAKHVPAGGEEVLDEAYGEGPDERLDVYRPRGGGPLPTVVWIHGGGW